MRLSGKMSKLILFILVVSFAYVFDKSDQAYVASSLYDDTVTNLGRRLTEIEESRFLADLDQKFEAKYPNLYEIPDWPELRQYNGYILSNLCVLAWNESPCQGCVRDCVPVIMLKNNQNMTLLTTAGPHLLDVLVCKCQHICPGSRNENYFNPFYITPYTATEYFKMCEWNILEAGYYKILDIVGNIPPYENISTASYYYD